MKIFHLIDIVRDRAEQRSFHVASEVWVRVEFVRFIAGGELDPVTMEGDTVVTCIEGTFVVGLEAQQLTPMSHAIVPGGEVLRLVCTSEAAVVQLIWAPPFGSAVRVGSEALTRGT